jgi:hypothetical protein
METNAPDDATGPTHITFVLHDPDTDGVAVKHDGEVVWQESTFDRFDQYARHAMPRGIPVVVDFEEG